MLFGALEAGGTKMVMAVGDEKGNILEQKSLPTLTPEETVPELLSYFSKKEICALGIGAFGPVDVNPQSKSFGHILDTPKLAWKNYNLYGAFQEKLGIPIGFDTDVNSSCLGEITFGQAGNLNSVVYLTIGTGIGAGIYVNGKLLHGMLHPEGGHIMITRHPEDSFEGCCPYHGGCLEGMAAGPAIEKRWGKRAAELEQESAVWELEAYYIAQALTNYILILSPEKIILGGGVMHQKQLFPLIREQVKKMLNGYINTKEISSLDQYIVPASLKDNQGILGCLQLAKLEYEQQVKYVQ
ncbi:ROK family protein [Anaeromicropila populeti]|uniref:fructokinase n=1 Tax=Anaeromicropila populeti TaxID=37658 RepID=A0A1I6IG63_9FIRM|nr:ROK family protein [Anaeromicropila populeti]SFR65644.1 fructokinase [Anaeromicropila populeti]